MSHIRPFDHVGITGLDLDTASGIPDSRTEIVMLQAPGGGTQLELSGWRRTATGWSAGSASTSTYGA